MWSLIKFVVGLWVFLIILVAMVSFLNTADDCDHLGGNYNITSDGFKCQGAKK